MFDYLQKYKNLPKDLRDKISTPAVLSMIAGLEKKYNVNLAAVIIKAVVKDIDANNLINYFIQEFKLDQIKAAALADELNKKVFSEISAYFNKAGEVPLPKEVGAKSAKTEQPVSQSAKDIFIPISKINIADKKIGGANFFFSAEDEEEIRKLAKNMDGSMISHSNKEQKEEIINEIIKEVKINFGSGLLASRFKAIIRTYVRGIRDRVDTRESLIKPIEQGGLSFDEESTDKVILIANQIIKKRNIKIAADVNQKNFSGDRQPIPNPPLPEELKLKTNLIKDIGLRDIAYNFKESLKKSKNNENFRTLDTAHELAPLLPKIAKSTPIKKNIEEEKFKKQATGSFIISKPENNNKIDEHPSIINIRPPKELIGKIKMEDIKSMPRVMGPIDELRSMNLVNFRRINNQPFLSAQKIKEKISLLEEEEYGKKIEGIRAWRQSPLYKLYLSIGQESISNNKPINAIIEERKDKNNIYLTGQEFEAIMDLNKSLRF